MKPISLEIPTPLLPVSKIPVITWLVYFYLQHGVDDIKIVINKKYYNDFLKWKITQFPKEQIDFIVETHQTGTFVPIARETGSWFNETMVISNGDELKEFDLPRMLRWHNNKKALVTLGLVRVDDPYNYGVVLYNRNGQVTNFLQKPTNPHSSYIWNGLCIANPGVKKYLEEKKKFAMVEEDLFPRLIKEKKLYAYRCGGQWYDCGTLERWEKAIKNWNGPIRLQKRRKISPKKQ